MDQNPGAARLPHSQAPQQARRVWQIHLAVEIPERTATLGLTRSGMSRFQRGHSPTKTSSAGPIMSRAPAASRSIDKSPPGNRTVVGNAVN
jgi:hypothetical protein